MEEQNETTFENARVGDRVWDAAYGAVVIEEATHEQIVVRTCIGGDQIVFNTKGHLCLGTSGWSDVMIYAPLRTLFWSEIQITPPPRPKRKVVKRVERWAVILPDNHQPDGVGVWLCISREAAEDDAKPHGGTVSGPHYFEGEVEE